jgi:hypothetical protein
VILQEVLNGRYLPFCKTPRDFNLARSLGFDDVSLPTFNAVHARYRTLLLECASSNDLSEVWELDEALIAAREELGQMR